VRRGLPVLHGNRRSQVHALEPLRRVYEQEYTLLGRLKKKVGLSKPVTDDELDQWQELVYDSCTLCGRCSLVCPVGNDLVYMVRKFREGMAVSGHVPDGIKGATQRTVETGGPMGLKWPAVANVLKKAEAATGLTIPVDQEGADYLVLLSSMEIVNYPEYIEAIAKILHKAGFSFTLASDQCRHPDRQFGPGEGDRVAHRRRRRASEGEEGSVARMRPCLYGDPLGRPQSGRPSLRLRGRARAGAA